MSDEEKQDLKEFRRLRNYYRKNFQNGDSDESFLLWLEQMCELDEKQNGGNDENTI